MYKKLLFLVLIPLFISAQKVPFVEDKPIVLVTIAPYAYFVERIAGDTVHIQTLVPPEMNIHIYEPSPRLVETSGQAKVWFRIDEPFENKIVKAFGERSPNLKIINLQSGLKLLAEGDLVEHGSCGHHHGGKDLHTWTSPKMALQQSQVIADTLISLFPDRKAFYQKNFDSLSDDLNDLDQELSSTLYPFKGEAILISHPSLGYFCKDYGLLQLSVECEGKDPKPQDVQALVQMANVYKVRCVLVQKGFNNRGAQLFSAKLKLPLYHIDPYAKDYLNNMRTIAGYIAK